MSLVRAMLTGRTTDYDVATVLGTQFGMQKLGKMRTELMQEITTNPKALDEITTIMQAGKAQDTGAKAVAMSLIKKIPSALQHVGSSLYKQGSTVAPAIITQSAEDRVSP